MTGVTTPSAAEWIEIAGERAEYIYGQRLDKQLPSGSHSDCQNYILFALTAYGRQAGLGKARPEWHHRFGPEDDQRVYVPDIAFLLPPRHLNPPEYADAASDLMIEILSPGDTYGYVTDKLEFYLRNGACGVWLVDPRLKRVDVCKPGQPEQRFQGADVLRDALLPGFELPLAELFAVTDPSLGEAREPARG